MTRSGAHGTAGFYPSWSHFTASFYGHLSFQGVFLGAPSPGVTCRLRCAWQPPRLAAGAGKGRRAKASGPRKLSKTWQPSHRGTLIFSPVWRGRSPNAIPSHYLYRKNTHILEFTTRVAS